MTWRLVHLWLALVSGIFLVIASLTGIVLSFEPVFEYNQPFHVHNAASLSLADVLENVKSEHDEILRIARDENGFVSIHVFNEEDQKFYINPHNGERLGELFETPTVFDFCRSLHRSLFLGATGRFLIGVTAVFLLFSCLSGFILTIRKQGSFKAYFSKVIRNEFFRDYHTRAGRVFIFTLLIIASSGTYLFLEQFSLIPKFQSQHTPDYESLRASPKQEINTFAVFTTHNLAQLEEIIFPFSEDVEEFFEVKLQDREMLINQFTGEVVSAIQYPSTKILSRWSFILHTGEGNAWWAIILGISAGGLLFFMYSGFAIYSKRGKSKIINPFSKEVCADIVLVGSEHGSTLQFARHFRDQLSKHNRKCYLTEMNAFEEFPNMERLFVFTSTHGAGEPPANARNFQKRFDKNADRLKPFQFAVLGFGSTTYPKFCAFAQDVDRATIPPPQGNMLFETRYNRQPVAYLIRSVANPF